jgi:anti-sigma regulatory factor (Ser/Thr protein kinase)
MTIDRKSQLQERLEIHSDLSEMSQVPRWLGRMARQHGIPDNVESAINLCLEEAISNIIRHGYAGRSNCPITVNFSMPHEGFFVFAVEDEAPRFDPLLPPELGPLNAREDARVGGQGIRFLRRFANRLEYEPRAVGNRLIMGFSAADSTKPGE